MSGKTQRFLGGAVSSGVDVSESSRAKGGLSSPRKEAEVNWLPIENQEIFGYKFLEHNFMELVLNTG